MCVFSCLGSLMFDPTTPIPCLLGYQHYVATLAQQSDCRTPTADYRLRITLHRRRLQTTDHLAWTTDYMAAWDKGAKLLRMYKKFTFILHAWLPKKREIGNHYAVT
jgi:hypothetical protein